MCGEQWGGRCFLSDCRGKRVNKEGWGSTNMTSPVILIIIGTPAKIRPWQNGPKRSNITHKYCELVNMHSHIPVMIRMSNITSGFRNPHPGFEKPWCSGCRMMEIKLMLLIVVMCSQLQPCSTQCKEQKQWYHFDDSQKDLIGPECCKLSLVEMTRNREFYLKSSSCTLDVALLVKLCFQKYLD